MNIHYSCDRIPSAEQVIELYENAGLPRPTNDTERIGKMIRAANIVVTAWNDELLVGVARSLGDFSWCCYLADLAVRKEYQQQGIGKKLVEITKQQAGEQSMVLLLSVPAAMEYYLRIGMQHLDNAFLLPRKI